MRPRSSMMTTASRVAASSASTSGVGAVMPRHDTPCESLVVRVDWLGSKRLAPCARLRRIQQLGVYFGFRRQPVLYLVAGRETSLFGTEERGFGDQCSAPLEVDEAGHGECGFADAGRCARRALPCGRRCRTFLT